MHNMFKAVPSSVLAGAALKERANARIERTIGAGILVEERRKLAPLAAHPRCWKGISLSGGSTAQSKERDPNLAVLPQKKACRYRPELGVASEASWR